VTKFKIFLRQHSLAIVFSIGIIFVLVGLLFAIWPKPHPNIATVLISVGASLIAASMTTILSPVTEEVYQRFLKMGVTEVYASRKDIDPHRWCELLASASEKSMLVGIAHHEWARDTEFEPTIMDRVRHKVKIEIYFLDPNCEIAAKRSEEDTGRDLVNTIKKSIEVMWKIRNKLEGGVRENFKLYVYSATPVGTTWVDNVIVASHYLAAFQNLTSPALTLRPVSPKDMYSVYAANARAIAEHATELTDEIIHQYQPPPKPLADAQAANDNPAVSRPAAGGREPGRDN
jgi:hypothetical protein